MYTDAHCSVDSRVHATRAVFSTLQRNEERQMWPKGHHARARLQARELLPQHVVFSCRLLRVSPSCAGDHAAHHLVLNRETFMPPLRPITRRAMVAGLLIAGACSSLAAEPKPEPK